MRDECDSCDRFISKWTDKYLKKRHVGEISCLCFPGSSHLMLTEASCARDVGPYLVHVGALLPTEAGYPQQQQLNVLGDPPLVTK